MCELASERGPHSDQRLAAYAIYSNFSFLVSIRLSSTREGPSVRLSTLDSSGRGEGGGDNLLGSSQETAIATCQLGHHRPNNESILERGTLLNREIA